MPATMPATKNDDRRFPLWVKAILLIATAILLYIGLGAGVYFWKEYVPHHEAGALGTLGALHRMEKIYKAEKGFYAGGFAELGLPLGARLYNGILTWDDGYDYRLCDVSTDSFGRVTSYAIAARPVKYRIGSLKSYLLVPSGTIHVTYANRSANRHDHGIAPD